MKIEPGADAPSFEKISACVHCGLCLEACPTYRELRVEMDSPRGRIYLMKGILQERLEPTEDVLVHLDRCLDCRACETACPSGVEYGDLLEKTRTLLERARRDPHPFVRQEAESALEGESAGEATTVAADPETIRDAS